MKKNLSSVFFLTIAFLSFAMTFPKHIVTQRQGSITLTNQSYLKTELNIPKNPFEQLAGVMANFCEATRRGDVLGQRTLTAACLQIIHEMQSNGITGIEYHPSIQFILEQTDFLECWKKYHGTLATLLRALSNNSEHVCSTVLNIGLAVALRNGTTVDTSGTTFSKGNNPEHVQHRIYVTSHRGHNKVYDPLSHTIKPLATAANSVFQIGASVINESNQPFPLDNRPPSSNTYSIEPFVLISLLAAAGVFVYNSLDGTTNTDPTVLPPLPPAPTHEP